MFEGLDQAFLKSNDAWVQSYKLVDWADIATIDKLIVTTESLVQKYNNPNEDVKRNIYQVFGELLDRYPLFYGYWKRFVAVKYQLDGLDASIATLEQSLDSFPTSLDLWIDLLNVRLTHNQNDHELVRSQFEKCESLVGFHFLSHDIWDKHIAFETKLKGWENLYKIYRKLIKLPLHQYARYYSSFKEFLEYHPEFSNKDPNFDIDAVFVANQVIVNKLWTYESKIKQPFFNIPELPESELQNWDSYLAFLLTDSSFEPDLIKCTFERCLIPCLKYEHFWDAYITWMEKTSPFEAVFPLFKRATEALPAQNKSFKVKYIQFLEKHLDPNDNLSVKYYMDALYAFQLKWPKDSSSIYKYLKLYKKRNFPWSSDDDDKKILEQHKGYAVFLDNIIKAYLSENTAQMETLGQSQQLMAMLNDTNLSILVVELIKIYWLVLKNIIQCRKYFTYFTKLDQLKSSVTFWLTYYKFEKSQRNVARLTKFVDQLGSEIPLPTQAINYIVQDFQSFYLMNADFAEYENSLSTSRFGYDPIIHAELKINNPTWKPNPKLSKDWFKSDEYKSNGHPGLLVDKPQIKNTIIGSLSTKSSKGNKAAPLPAFRNLEKIHQKPCYEDYMSIDYLK